MWEIPLINKNHMSYNMELYYSHTEKREYPTYQDNEHNHMILT